MLLSKRVARAFSRARYGAFRVGGKEKRRARGATLSSPLDGCRECGFLAKTEIARLIVLNWNLLCGLFPRAERRILLQIR